MFATLEQAQQDSVIGARRLIDDAMESGKDSFYILEVIQTIGDDGNLKYRSLLQGMDVFTEQEINCLGFQTMLTRFTRAPDGKRLIARKLYHLLDKDKTMIVHSMKDSAFEKLLKSQDNKDVITMLRSTRQHAKRLLNGKK